MIVTPNQTDINTALRSFLLSVLPNNTDVIAGQVNRVPEPVNSDFVVMWPINRVRLDTNSDIWADVAFTADIAGSTMNVSAVSHGVIEVGATVFGIGVPVALTVKSFGTGSGGIGTYNLDGSVITPSRRTACGAINTMQATEVVIQLDVHGPASSDNAQVISTLLRDEYGAVTLKAANPNIFPLFADDPKQIPFMNAEKQLETRWIVDAHLQVNQTVRVPQQFADEVHVDFVAVDEFIPPPSP